MRKYLVKNKCLLAKVIVLYVLLQLLFPLACGWDQVPTNDYFFHQAQHEIDYLHQSLISPDSHQIASDKVQGKALCLLVTISKYLSNALYSEHLGEISSQSIRFNSRSMYFLGLKVGITTLQGC